MLLLSSVLLLALAAGRAPSDGAAGLSLPVEVRVLKGRATLLLGTEVVSCSPAAGARAVEGPIELEIGPSSQVEILWRGRGSLRVQGPAALSLPDSSARPLEPRVELLFAAAVEVEVRRGTVRAGLAGLGELEMKRCAVALGELPGGAWSLLHRGGKAARFRPAGLAVSSEIQSGARTRLEARAD